MRKKIVISLAAIAIVFLGTVGAWAYKSGKLSGLADAISGTQSFSLQISVKEIVNAVPTNNLDAQIYYSNSGSNFDQTACSSSTSLKNPSGGISAGSISKSEDSKMLSIPIRSGVTDYYIRVKSTSLESCAFGVYSYGTGAIDGTFQSVLKISNPQAGSTISAIFVTSQSGGGDGGVNPPAGKSTIRGVAYVNIGGTSIPASGVKVFIPQLGSGAGGLTGVDTNGNYQFTDIKPGNYTLEFSGECKVDKKNIVVNAGSGQNVRAPDVILASGGVPSDKWKLEGYINDGTPGKKLDGATVKLETPQIVGSSPQSITTDPSGYYSFCPLGNLTYKITAIKGDYKDQSIDINGLQVARGIVEKRDITLVYSPQTLTLYGQVRYESGEPAGGVTVKLREWEHVEPSPPLLNLSTTSTAEYSRPSGIATDTNYIITNIPRNIMRTYFVLLDNEPSGYILKDDSDLEPNGIATVTFSESSGSLRRDLILKHENTEGMFIIHGDVRDKNDQILDGVNIEIRSREDGKIISVQSTNDPYGLGNYWSPEIQYTDITKKYDVRFTKTGFINDSNNDGVADGQYTIRPDNWYGIIPQTVHMREDTSGKIVVNYNNLPVGVDYPQRMRALADKTYLEKFDNGKWEKVKIADNDKIIEIPSLTINIFRTIFKPPTDGKYRARIEGFGTKSQESKFTSPSSTALDLPLDFEVYKSWATRTHGKVSIFVDDIDIDLLNNNNDFWKSISGLINKIKNMTSDQSETLIMLMDCGGFMDVCKTTPPSGDQSGNRIIYVDVHSIENSIIMGDLDNARYEIIYQFASQDIYGKQQNTNFLDGHITTMIQGMTKKSLLDQFIDYYNKDTRFKILSYNSNNNFFAVFLSKYFLSHSQIKDNLSKEPNPQIKYLKQFTYQIIAENIGTIDDDDKTFLQPLGGKIGSSRYTFSQIINGSWIQRIYNKLNITQKAQVQFRKIVSPRLESSITLIIQSVARLNDVISNLIKKAGIKNLGDVKGTVKDESGRPVVKTVIRVGPKSAVTDSAGKYRINNIPVGNATIAVKKNDGTSYKVTSPASASANIVKNTVSSAIIVIEK